MLLNRQRYEERSPGVFVPTQEMRAIEVETRAITNLGFGRADWGGLAPQALTTRIGKHRAAANAGFFEF